MVDSPLSLVVFPYSNLNGVRHTAIHGVDMALHLQVASNLFLSGQLFLGHRDKSIHVWGDGSRSGGRSSLTPQEA